MTCFDATDEINNNSPANKLIAFLAVFTAEMNLEINLPNSKELLLSQMMSSQRLWEKMGTVRGTASDHFKKPKGASVSLCLIIEIHKCRLNLLHYFIFHLYDDVFFSLD